MPKNNDPFVNLIYTTILYILSLSTLTYQSDDNFIYKNAVVTAYTSLKKIVLKLNAVLIKCNIFLSIYRVKLSHHEKLFKKRQ